MLAYTNNLYVTEFEKVIFYTQLLNINFNCLKCSILGRKKDACMQLTMVLYSLSIHKLLNGLLAELPAILDSFLLAMPIP